MKKIILLLSFMFFSLCIASGCSFVSYNSGLSSEDVAKIQEVEDKKKDYIEQLKTLYTEDDYRQEEKATYLDALRDAVNEINESETTEEAEEAYLYHVSVIDGIKTDDDYIIEEREALLSYKKNAEKEIDNFDISPYREEQQNAILLDAEKAKNAINSAVDKTEVDNAIRSFQVDVYQYKTDKELYAEELESLKTQTVSDIGVYVIANDYRQNEQLILSTVKSNYIALVLSSETKKEVLNAFASYTEIVNSVKTDAELYEEEKQVMIEDYYRQLLELSDPDSKEPEVAEKLITYYFNVKNDMLLLKTKEAVTGKFLSEKENVYVTLAKSGDVESLELLKGVYAEKISNLVDITKYRVAQQEEITRYITEYTDLLNQASNYDETVKLVEEGEQLISEVLTNDEMWLKEDEEFISSMSLKYGDDCLEMPLKINEADDHFALANIIDYYAFYQTSYQSFERQTFRVKLNYEHKDAQYEINKVYWYCELIRSAVGITGWFEDNDFLVIQLIPYQIATVSNIADIKIYPRLENTVRFDSDKSTMVKRDNQYNGFAYKSNKKLTGIWNTQQLWYALEQGYCPVCVEGSVADKTLRRAEDILREIIMDGMSDEEKIFNIYTWFGENVQYDYYYTRNLGSSDLTRFPDEQAALSKAFHVEGAIFDGIAVCEGFAKSYLMMLRIEGIESLRVFVHVADDNSITHDLTGYGSHAFVAIKMADGKYYYSDVQQTFNSWEVLSYQQLMIPPALLSSYNGGFTPLNKDKPMGETPHSIYSKLVVGAASCYVTNNEELAKIKEVYSNYSGSKMQLTVLADEKIYADFKRDLLQDTNFTYEDYFERSTGDIKSQLTEIVLFRKQ